MGYDMAMRDRGSGRSRSLRLQRGRPRSYPEWRALRRWEKLPVWERDVPGYLLRMARCDAGLTQSELAAALGITQQAVSRAEQWQSNPTVGMMRRWVAQCGRSLVLGVQVPGRSASEPSTTT
jgi:DNA-binding XRE family transcriptional regulator